jgi:HEAT repeat protein
MHLQRTTEESAMKKILYLTCGFALLATGAGAQRSHAARSAGILVLPAEDPADSLYRVAHAAMTNRDFRKAAGLYQQVVDKYPKSKNVGDALYWRGYSLFQLGQETGSKSDYTAALVSLDQYTKEFRKDSAQVNDARELHSRIQAAQAKLGDAKAAGDIAKSAQGLTQPRSCSGSEADEETRMAALEGLLSMNSDDAVPILKDVLKQRDTCRVELRKKAVWLIAQKRAPDVVATLLDVARNDPSVDVRGDAVWWLSQTHSEQVVPALDSILFTSRDDEMRKKAIFSLSQFHDERALQSLRKAVEDERIPEEIRGEAIFWLGQSPSNANLDYFKSVFKKTHNEELRSKIVQAVSNTSTSEAGNWLLDVARDKSYDIETRKNAIFWASQRKLFDFEQMTNIYDQAKGDEEIQEQVLFVYSQRREPAAVDKLMTIAKSDPNVEMRKKALFWLGQKNDPRVKQFIRDLIYK